MFSWVTNIIKEVRELKYLAYHDSLTNLLNRNWLYKNFDNIKHKYVYFIDINNLHHINKHGHIFGDDYIIEMVNSIKLEQGEILIRYAGDEFILFSNKINRIKTNNIYSVGYCEIVGSIKSAIYIADKEMLRNKIIFKKS